MDRRTGKNGWTEAQMAVWGRRKETHPSWHVGGGGGDGRRPDPAGARAARRSPVSPETPNSREGLRGGAPGLV